VREPAELNRDPITRQPGSHPIGTAAGSTAGAATGAAIGSAAGPAGTIVGGVVGAVAGGLAGHAAAEKVNPTAEESYWEENHRSRPYINRSYSYDEYRPAYRYGWESRTRHRGRRFDEVEGELEREWENYRGDSPLRWDEARDAARDAWDRVDERP
jgi:phage tail tape-measure protein